MVIISICILPLTCRKEKEMLIGYMYMIVADLNPKYQINLEPEKYQIR